MVTFGRKKIVPNFYLVYDRFCSKNLLPIQQKLEVVVFGQFSSKFRVFLMFKGLNKKNWTQFVRKCSPEYLATITILNFQNDSKLCIKFLFLYAEL